MEQMVALNGGGGYSIISRHFLVQLSHIMNEFPVYCVFSKYSCAIPKSYMTSNSYTRSITPHNNRTVSVLCSTACVLCTVCSMLLRDEVGTCRELAIDNHDRHVPYITNIGCVLSLCDYRCY
ncbi:hypothetical protein J6590_091260 [Homalodisca vitripennis]|nr:hypothetical protein J6590_091260 [Homalodisca vitripennis]